MLFLRYFASNTCRWSINVSYFYYHTYHTYLCHTNCSRRPVPYTSCPTSVQRKIQFLIAKGFCWTSVPLPSSVSPGVSVLLMETSSCLGVTWICGLGIWHQLSDCKRGLEAQTGSENCTVYHLTQIDSFTVFKGREH